MAITASRSRVSLAGGTQMLAVYAPIRSISRAYNLAWQPEQVVVGTPLGSRRPTGKTVELAKMVGCVPLLATQFVTSRYPQLGV